MSPAVLGKLTPDHRMIHSHTKMRQSAAFSSMTADVSTVQTPGRLAW